MLRHRIVGKSKLSKEEINAAVGLFCEEMFPKSLYKDSFLVINSTDPKDGLEELDVTNCYGVMYARDVKHRAHKKFSIWINSNISKKQQLITLFHELVHVKQARLGHLKFSGMSMTKWCSRSIDSVRGEPWEKDPVRLESKLYKKYEERRKRCMKAKKKVSGQFKRLTKKAT